MATVRNLACIAFRPEALDVHALSHEHEYQQKSKSISSAEPNYFVHFAMRYPVHRIIAMIQIGLEIR